MDEIKENLEKLGLPTEAKGNAGQGEPAPAAAPAAAACLPARLRQCGGMWRACPGCA